MRFFLVAALLVGTAACAWQPPPPPPQAVAVPAVPPPGAAGPVALVQQPVAPLPPAPPPAVAVAAASPLYLLDPVPFVGALLSPLTGRHPVPGRLTLSNFTYDTAHVEAVATPYPDCAIRPGMTPADFTLPLNGTRVIAVPPGTDVCWRRELPTTVAAEGASTDTPPPSPTPASPGGWAPWNRAFTSSGHLIDSQL